MQRAKRSQEAKVLELQDQASRTRRRREAGSRTRKWRSFLTVGLLTLRLYAQLCMERQMPPMRSPEGGRPAARRDSERTAVWVSTRAMCGVRVGESEGGQGGAVPGPKAGRHGGGDTERIGAFSSYPDIQKQLADLDATISRLNSDPDPEIQAIVSKRRAQREELVLQLRAAKPLPVQLKIASEARDKANKKRDAIKQEVDNLEQLLALKKADLMEATTVATETQSEYLRLAAAAASEGPSLQNMAAQQQAAAIQLVGLLPPQAAASFQSWWQQVLQDGSGTEEELSQKTQSCSNGWRLLQVSCHQLPSSCHRETRTHREALREQQHRTLLRLFGWPRGTASNHTRQAASRVRADGRAVEGKPRLVGSEGLPRI